MFFDLICDWKIFLFLQVLNLAWSVLVRVENSRPLPSRGTTSRDRRVLWSTVGVSMTTLRCLMDIWKGHLAWVVALYCAAFDLQKLEYFTHRLSKTVCAGLTILRVTLRSVSEEVHPSSSPAWPAVNSFRPKKLGEDIWSQRLEQFSLKYNPHHFVLV